MKRMNGAWWACAALVGLVVVGSPQAAPPADDIGNIMKVKLHHTQQLIGAIVTEDYPAVTQHAGALELLSHDAGWMVLQTRDYRRHSDDFRRQTSAIVTAAKKESLDGVTLGYVQMTLSCVECHKHVRDVRRRGE